MRRLWPHGTIDLQVAKSLRSSGAYIAKYITKELTDSRLFGQKLYFTSRGLKRPIHSWDELYIDKKLQDPTLETITAYNGAGYIKTKYKRHASST